VVASQHVQRTHSAVHTTLGNNPPPPLNTHSTNIATGASSSSSSGATATATVPSRHDLLVAAYRFFDASLTLPTGGGGGGGGGGGTGAGAITEADERRRVVLLMVSSDSDVLRSLFHFTFLLMLGGVLDEDALTHPFSSLTCTRPRQLAVSASLAARTGDGGGGLTARERSYWLAQLGDIRRHVH
jgi:hypothetical protein